MFKDENLRRRIRKKAKNGLVYKAKRDERATVLGPEPKDVLGYTERDPVEAVLHGNSDEDDPFFIRRS